MSNSDSIKLQKAPLVEAILGVNFEVNPGFSGYLLGRFSTEIKDEFSTPTVREGDNLDPKVKLVTSDGDFALQILNNGFFLSWVKSKDGCAYPDFEPFFEKFQGLFSTYLAFLAANQMPQPPVNGLSMGYINRVERPPGKERVWLPDVFPDLAWRPGKRRLAAPSVISLFTSFGFPDHSGVVNVRIDGPWAQGKSNTLDSVRFLLEAKSKFSSKIGMSEVWEWFTRAKSNLNIVFLDLTSDEFREKYWS